MKALMVLLTLFALSCGSALVDTHYRGEPLFHFEGIIFSVLEDIPEEGKTKVALGWSRTEPDHFDLNQITIQDSLSAHVRFPSVFEINIFYPPESAYLETLDTQWALAYLLVFEDHNDNGELDEDEFIGGAPDQALIYTPETLEAESSPTGQLLPEGFHLVPMPMPCEFLPDITGQDCGVDLGTACQTSSDCGVGTCLREIDGLDFPDGYCSLQIDWSANGCIPAGGIEIDVGIHESDGWWAKRCHSNDECRVDEGYACDLGAGACLPKFPVWLVIERDLDFASFCHDYLDDDWD